MLDGPFTFFRGTNHLFVRDWPELQPPELGPDILICGDLHLENFGAYRTAEGDFRYDINDFDESIVAPSMDLVRYRNVFLAAEEWRLTPTQATTMAMAYLRYYRRAVLTWPPGTTPWVVLSVPTCGEGQSGGCWARR